MATPAAEVAALDVQPRDRDRRPARCRRRPGRRARSSACRATVTGRHRSTPWASGPGRRRGRGPGHHPDVASPGARCPPDGPVSHQARRHRRGSPGPRPRPRGPACRRSARVRSTSSEPVRRAPLPAPSQQQQGPEPEAERRERDPGGQHRPAGHRWEPTRVDRSGGRTRRNRISNQSNGFRRLEADDVDDHGATGRRPHGLVGQQPRAVDLEPDRVAARPDTRARPARRRPARCWPTCRRPAPAGPVPCETLRTTMELGEWAATVSRSSNT